MIHPLRVLLTSVILCLLTAQVLAEPRSFEIPAGDASEALQEFARQSQLQTLFDYRLVSKLHTRAVSGQLEPEDALTRMLDGTGLTFERVDEHTIAIRGSTADAATHLEEVVVSSRLPASKEDSPVPVEVYSRQKIAASGAATVTEFLNTLPAVSIQTTTTGQYQLQNGATTVQLRGLPAGTTLVLVNGRRVQTSGSAAGIGFFDLNSIPVAAVERIEVMPTGSSAVYGGDALGGIVNLVLRQDFKGLEADVRYGGTSDGAYHDRSVSIAAGATGERWNASIIGTWFSNSELSGNERPLTADQNYTRFGGIDMRFPYANPGNVCSVNGSNLSGVGAPCTTPRETSLSSYYSFVAPATRYGIFASGTYRVTDDIEIFAELMYSHFQQRLYVYPPVDALSVPAGNVNNPYGQDVSVNYLFTGYGRICGQCVSSDYYRPLVGVRGKAFGTWSWEIAGWTSRDTTGIPTGFTALDTTAIDAALANGTFNPFVGGAGGAASVLHSFIQPAPVRNRDSLDSLNAFLRGPVATWYAGAIDVVLGGEFGHDRVRFDDPGNFQQGDLNSSRNDAAGFAEMKLPLLSDGRLSAQGAARYDHYSDFGGRGSYGASLEWKPWSVLRVRAAYSTAFKPPTLYQLHAPLTTFEALVLDPARGNTYDLAVNASGGNANLKPETGSSTNLGVVFQPATLPGLEVELTHWTARLSNGFESLGANVIAKYPDLFTGRIVRAPAPPGDPYGVGPITYVDQSYTNFGFVHEAGVDLSATWRIATPWGEWTPSLAATETYRYDFEFSPGVGATNAVSQANDESQYAPRWKAVLGLNWQLRPVQLGIAGRYTGAYKDVTDVRADPATLGNFWYIDLNSRVQWGHLFVAAGARNVFNKQPVYSDFGFGFSGYDANEYDLMGRYLWMQAGWQL